MNPQRLVVMFDDVVGTCCEIEYSPEFGCTADLQAPCPCVGVVIGLCDQREKFELCLRLGVRVAFGELGRGLGIAFVGNDKDRTELH